jgi:hypothetical protein
MRQQSDPAHVVMPGVHRVASLLQRWLLGTHQGRVSHDHRRLPQRVHLPLQPPPAPGGEGLLFYRLLEQAVVSLTRSPTKASSSTPLPPAADLRARRVRAESPPWRPFTGHGAKTP